MKPLDLDALERLAKAATPGEWVATQYEFCPISAKQTDGRTVDIMRAQDGHVYSEYSADCATIGMSEQDAAFIAAANPQTVLRLIQMARAQQPAQYAVYGLSNAGKNPRNDR